MSTLTTHNPFENIVDLFFNERERTPLRKKSQTPAMNATANDEALTLSFQIPGFAKEEISINLEDRVLTISAQNDKAEAQESKKTVWLRREISSHSFKRAVTIPENIDTQKISADCQNGILTLTLPKIPKEDKVINISIN